MAGQEKVLEKKRGRPAIGKGVQLNTQLRPEMAEALDAWAADQPDAPARPEAIRRVLTEHLGATGHLGPVEGTSQPYTEPAGTSMASPLIAGLAATLIEQATARLGEAETAALLRQAIANLSQVERAAKPKGEG